MDETTHHRTVVTYEVLTVNEAFNGGAKDLGELVAVGDANAALIDRRTEEVSADVFDRLASLQDQIGDLRQ